MGNVGVIANPTLSPDNSRVAMDVSDAKANDVNIWLSDLKHGTSSRFTFDPAEDNSAVWSCDGTWFVGSATVGNEEDEQAAGQRGAHE